MSGSRPKETVVDVGRRGHTGFAARVYDELLVPAFRPDELDQRDDFLAQVLAPAGGVTALALAEGEQGDTPLGVIVGYEYPDAHVLLIGYLAVRPALRSGGRGATLLDAAHRRWSRQSWCQVALAEVEDPRYHSHPEQDPGRRLAFYQRNGAVLLARPYFQPRLRPGLSRVVGMLLIALWSSPGAGGPGGLRSEPVVEFLEQYFQEAEGAAGPEDAALRQLLASYRSAPTIGTLALDQYPSIVQIIPD